jgi:hypothetical protein
MKPQPLGTILPNPASEKKADRAFAERKATHLIAAKVLFKGMTHRFEDGEDRFYENADRFSTYSGQVRTFERKQDGYFYAVSSSSKKTKNK